MKAILFDMDGVLYNSAEPIAGAAETLDWVRRQKIPHLFVTNATSRGRGALVEKLARFGIHAGKEEILSPCVAAAQWLHARGECAIALFVQPAARVEFEGLKCLPEQAESGARYVVIGDLGEAWGFRTLNRAFRLLYSDPASRLIALGMTRFWRAQDGIALDVASFHRRAGTCHGAEGIGVRKARESFLSRGGREAAGPGRGDPHGRGRPRDRYRRGAAGGFERRAGTDRKIRAQRSKRGFERPSQAGCGAGFGSGAAKLVEAVCFR
jgi:phospholysine phosphohistidine inorganic pyrophosphate phosphatase